MGGLVAAHTAAERPGILGTALISCVDLGQAFGSGDPGHAAAAVDDNIGISAGLHILTGTSPDLLADEARRSADQWCLAAYASRLAGRPLLTVTSDDGFAGGSDALADVVQVLGGNCPADMSAVGYGKNHPHPVARPTPHRPFILRSYALNYGQEEIGVRTGTT